MLFSQFALSWLRRLFEWKTTLPVNKLRPKSLMFPNLDHPPHPDSSRIPPPCSDHPLNLFGTLTRVFWPRVTQLNWCLDQTNSEIFWISLLGMMKLLCSLRIFLPNILSPRATWQWFLPKVTSLRVGFGSMKLGSFPVTGLSQFLYSN